MFTVSELELGHELAEEVEAAQAEEIGLLRKEMERANVNVSEKELEVKQLQSKLGDIDRTVARFRNLVVELQDEREQLRQRLNVDSSTLEAFRGRAQDALGQVQSLRADAKAARGRAMSEALALLECAGASTRVARYNAFLPREFLDMESTTLEGDFTLCRVFSKSALAIDTMMEGYQPWMQRQRQASQLRQETGHERIERCLHEAKVGCLVLRGQRAAITVLLRIQHPLFQTDPDR